MGRIRIIVGVVVALASIGVAPVSAQDEVPGAPTSVTVTEDGTVSWVPGTGSVNYHIVEREETRVPSGWLERSFGLSASAVDLEPFVVGGDDANIGRHRYTALLIGFDGQNEPVIQCGAAIIDPRWVVTAAHCTHYQPTGTYHLEPEYFAVVYGLGDWTDPNVDLEPHLQYSDRVTVHPDYRRGLAEHDIALMQLDGPVDPAQGHPIPLFDVDGPPDGAAAYVTGWGATTDGGFTNAELQGLNVTIDASCGDWPAENPDDWDDDLFLCASGHPGGACHGDSGGPLVVNRSGAVMLAGIVSFGALEGCAASATKPDVYTRVSTHVGWMRSVVGGVVPRTVLPGRTSVSLGPMRPGRTYVVTVRAVNDAGMRAGVTTFTMPGTMIFTKFELGVSCSSSKPPVFLDVPRSSFAYGDVGCISELGVTTGTSELLYSPAASVTREQMAAFIERLYERLTGRSCGGRHPFTDVPRTSFAYNSVGCIYNLGITTGTSATTYGPKQTVTREQMAAFIARLYRLLTDEACGSNPPFRDVASSSFARRDIGCLADLDITTGTSPTTYAPKQTVTREQMAAFLARLFHIVSE